MDRKISGSSAHHGEANLAGDNDVVAIIAVDLASSGNNLFVRDGAIANGGAVDAFALGIVIKKSLLSPVAIKAAILVELVQGLFATGFGRQQTSGGKNRPFGAG